MSEEETFDPKNYSYSTRDWEKYPPQSSLDNAIRILLKTLMTPAIYVKENWIKPNQKTYYWYHRKFRRVPTIDQCYEHDYICHFEADEQLDRDQKVDSAIIGLLYERWDECMFYEKNERERCREMYNAMKDAETNFFIKYGDVGCGADYTRRIFMKQKHRLLWERRHGPVGTGMKEKHYHVDGTPYYK